MIGGGRDESEEFAPECLFFVTTAAFSTAVVKNGMFGKSTIHYRDTLALYTTTFL